MEATKDYISLETAKLLKDSPIKSKYVYNYIDPNIPIIIHRYDFMEEMPQIKFYPPYRENITAEYYPAYTWQEILWEYPVLFFGNEEGSEYYKSINILQKLQDKQYDEADKYFKDNCILIKKTPMI
jgi:hypothetical protein